jgi:hypothetical protein
LRIEHLNELRLRFDVLATNQQPIKTSISIKDFVREKKIRNRKKKEQQKFLLKFNTKPLKFKCGLADRGGGRRAGRAMQGMGTPT